MQPKFKSNLKKRFLATLLDYGIFFSLFYAFVVNFGRMEGHAWRVSGLLAFTPVLAWIFYFVLSEVFFGGTLGYIAFDLRVYSEKLEQVGTRQAFLRHLFDPVDILGCYGLIAYISIRRTEKHQRIGDLIARTVVIDKSDPEQYVRYTPFGEK